MSETGDVSNDAIEEALMDHHLDEVAEMIERVHAHKASCDSPFTDCSAGCLHGS